EQLCSQAGVTGTLRARLYRDKVVPGIGDRLRTSGITDYQEMKERASIVAPDANREYQRYLKGKGIKDKTHKRDNQGRFQGKAANIDPGNKINCWNCNKPGHVVHQCEQPKDQTRIRKAREKTQAARNTRREIPPRDEMDLNQVENLEGEYEQASYARYELPRQGKGQGSNGPTHGSIQEEEL
ncbi:MAG TPA: hypothetical protein VM715_11180, partial [Candidatus Acidoferrum sp.]|nr:hypothetical protein [Candidatus Acidoferrum sp.]